MHAFLNSHKSIAAKSKHFVSGTCRCQQLNALRVYKHGRRIGNPHQISCPMLSSRLLSSFIRTSSTYRIRDAVQLNFVAPINNIIPYNSPFTNNQPSCCIVVVRHLHLGHRLYEKEPLKPSSKVEETVQVLKEDLKKASVDVTTDKPPLLKRIKKKVVDELVHYYHGFRLLFIDINISRKLVWRVLNGKSLTRREHRLLVRTVSDLFRLVPFSVFIIVPFMELLLPLAIKLFPGMLPSTFQTATEKDHKMKQALKVKLEMAKFLQQTLDDMAVQGKGRSSKSAKEFSEFFTKVRTSGEQASNEEIMKFSKLFEDEITLDSLSRPQLTALCRVMAEYNVEIMVIQKEGIESLTPAELQQACRARGMRAYGMSEDALRNQLAQWLELSLEKKVPPSLLLLSRALFLPETIPTSDQLKATISVLPDAVETKEILVDKAPVITDDVGAQPDILQATAVKQMDEKKLKEELTTTDFEALEDALDTLSKDKKILVEKELDVLKVELAEYQEDVDDLQKVVKVLDKSKAEVKESKAARRLFKKGHLKSIVYAEQFLMCRPFNCIFTMSVTLFRERLGCAKDEELVSIEELKDAIKRIQKVPDDSLVDRISEVLAKMDIDKDGAIRLDDVLKVIELVGKENVKLNKKQVDEIVDLMSKEELIELEEQIEKALEKGNQEELLEAEKEKKIEAEDKEKESIVKASVPVLDEKKKNDHSSEVSSVAAGAPAMSAAPPSQPPNVADPVDKKDNSKTL
ncbi:hypothetical protein C0J52_02342 [Blattella germanica]|nr:hypothetical protein C0J52_02342 [Blattella germanica]